MSRLRVCAALVLALMLWPLVASDAEAPAKMPRIGLLSTGTDPSRPLPPQWVAFFDGLRALGYVEGRNILSERRFAEGKSERVPAFATELVQLGVNLIVATGLRENEAARQATTTIPVVMIVVPDPVGIGLVAGLARPGGNVTGLTFGASGLAEKYVELLREAVPSATRMAVVVSRQQPAAPLEEMQGAARALKVALSTPTLVRGPEEYEPIFAQARRAGMGGLIFPTDALTVLHRQLIVDLVAKYRLPAIYTFREHAEAGGLMAYGASFPDLFRRAATFVDKILKGARPADLPVEQPTRFELVLNLKTAKTLGITFSPALLARADEVIR